MKWLPWILLAIVIIILALRGCEGPRDHSAYKHRYDSAAIAGAKLAVRNNALRSELTALRANSRAFQKAANQESDSLVKELAKARRHPRVVEVIKRVPAVAEAFARDDSVISFQFGRIRQLEYLDAKYKMTDSLFHLGQDTLINNFMFREKVLTNDNAALRKDLKKQSNPLSIGVNVGPGIVLTPDGKVTGGLVLSVGVNVKLRKRP
jgi:hypothetical protein